MSQLAVEAAVRFAYESPVIDCTKARPASFASVITWPTGAVAGGKPPFGLTYCHGLFGWPPGKFQPQSETVQTTPLAPEASSPRAVLPLCDWRIFRLSVACSCHCQRRLVSGL